MQEPQRPQKRHDHDHDCTLCRIALDNVGVVMQGQTLLSGVTTHLHCGELTALIGHNGAGKTTLVRAMLSQVPYSGAIRHLDHEGRPMSRLRVGYVPQRLDFDRSLPMSVQDFIASALTRRPVFIGVGKKAREEARRALRLTSAEELAGARMGALSGGELQRVMLALALTPAPDLLLMDEPVSGMDQNGLLQFLDILTSLKRTRHMAMLLVSHDFALVRKYADSVILLDKAVLVRGTPAEVFASEAFSRAFEAYRQPQERDAGGDPPEGGRG